MALHLQSLHDDLKAIMNQDYIINEIAHAQQTYDLAKSKLAEAKRAWVEIETAVINAKIALDRSKEKLRVYKITTISVVVEQREQEIAAFRERHPELVKQALERDLKESES